MTTKHKDRGRTLTPLYSIAIEVVRSDKAEMVTDEATFSILVQTNWTTDVEARLSVLVGCYRY